MANSNKSVKRRSPSSSSTSSKWQKSHKNLIIMGTAINIIIGAIAYAVYQHYFHLEPSAIVQTKLGAIVGTIGMSRGRNPFSQYLGIPYALPPTTPERRFEPPQPPNKWEGVKEMTEQKSVCIQLESFATGFILGQEDCLYLNVFVSHIGRIKKKPVLVYIHGGLFHVGGADGAGPKYFMDEDVILVAIGYRLGVMGFLATGDDVISGNMGLKDQTMALQWVQENIEYFGGDPKKITLFGESAGGASVHHHLLSPMSKNLFSKAIHESGSTINYWAVYRNVKEQAKRFAGKFGCPTSTSQEIAKCLKSLDAKKIVAVHKELMDVYRPQISTFVPTIEVPHAKSPFLTEEPMQILKEGRFPKIPLMTGINSNEGQLITKSMMIKQAKLNAANDNWDKWAPWKLHYPEELTNVTKKIRQFYFGSEEKINNTQFQQSFTDMFGDRLFIVKGAIAARLESKFTRTHLYYYDYSGNHNTGELLASVEQHSYLPNWLGIGIFLTKRFVLNLFNATPKKEAGHACHADEISMLFNREFVYTIGPSHPDYEMSRDLVKLWTTFASTDNSILRFRNVEWHPISVSDVKNKNDDDGVRYLRISEEPAVIAEPESVQKRRIFWESLNLPDL